MVKKRYPVLVVLALLMVAAAGFAVSSKPAAKATKSPYAAWKHGPSTDPKFFPIAVWLQVPVKAAEYRAIGINTYVGLWDKPTDEGLGQLRKAGMRVICGQDQVDPSRWSDPIFMGWMHGDEPDNAQAKTGGGYGPAIPTAKVIGDYHKIARKDPSRPVLLNLGQGVANDHWIGIGCDRSAYPEYVRGADIVSFDVYPVSSFPKPENEARLWLVAQGVDRLRAWSGDKKIVWNVVECTRSGDKRATPHEMRAEIWMSIIHGSRGIIYFCHQFEPSFIEAGLLADKEMAHAASEVNRQITSLAPVLNSPTLTGLASVASSDGNVPIDIMVKRDRGAIYVLSVGMRQGETQGTFTVKGLPAKAQAEVLGENRTLPVVKGVFRDTFTPWDTHLYRIRTER